MKALLVCARLNESPGSERFAWRLLATAVVLALLWLEVINQLKAGWSLNPQYGYGWSVPFLALTCFGGAGAPKAAGATLAGHCRGHLRISIFAAPVRRRTKSGLAFDQLGGVSLVRVAISIRFAFLARGKPRIRCFAFPFPFSHR
jgi:hypothetical protein